jgi:hypothetical protein
MEFFNPNMLWGLLAVSIPLLLHFWHQKKGKLLPWAATQWLREKALQQSRGLKLENLLLLLLRMLLVILLALIFAKPLMEYAWGKTTQTHWVYPKKAVIDNYKFELEEAKNKGEKLFWLNGEKIQNLDDIPAESDIQTGINRIQLERNQIAQIYLSNTADLSRFSKVFVPLKYNLHILNDSSKGGGVSQFIEIKNGKKLGLNSQGLLSKMEGEGNVVHSGQVKVLNQTSESGIPPALKAIEEVYEIAFEMDILRIPNKKYDLVFTHAPQEAHQYDGIVFISNAKSVPHEVLAGNRIYLKDKLTPETSELVFNGGLPELILEKMLPYLGLKGMQPVHSHQQIEAWFAERKIKKENQWISSILLIVLFGVLGVERWLAINKNT